MVGTLCSSSEEFGMDSICTSAISSSGLFVGCVRLSGGPMSFWVCFLYNITSRVGDIKIGIVLLSAKIMLTSVVPMVIFRLAMSRLTLCLRRNSSPNMTSFEMSVTKNSVVHLIPSISQDRVVFP